MNVRYILWDVRILKIMFALSCWHFQSFYRTCKQSEGRTVFPRFSCSLPQKLKNPFLCWRVGESATVLPTVLWIFFLSFSSGGNVALLLLLLFLAPFTYMLLFRLCLFMVICEKRNEKVEHVLIILIILIKNAKLELINLSFTTCVFLFQSIMIV